MPATAASDAPMTKVTEIVRSTSTPSSAAIIRSCSQARCARPSAVREIMSQNATINTTVTTQIRICMVLRVTMKPSLSAMAKLPPISGGRVLTRAPWVSCT